MNVKDRIAVKEMTKIIVIITVFFIKIFTISLYLNICVFQPQKQPKNAFIDDKMLKRFINQVNVF